MNMKPNITKKLETRKSLERLAEPAVSSKRNW